MYENLIYEVKDGIAYVTVNRPKSLNALSNEVLDVLYTAFTAVNIDRKLRSRILTGAWGKRLCSRRDIRKIGQASPLGRQSDDVQGTERH
jgi:enoyl-CoA hydratase/carnithine racemase